MFAPVARLDTVRLILAIAANRGWEVHHLDVKTSFLNGELAENVCVIARRFCEERKRAYGA